MLLRRGVAVAISFSTRQTRVQEGLKETDTESDPESEAEKGSWALLVIVHHTYKITLVSLQITAVSYDSSLRVTGALVRR